MNTKKGFTLLELLIVIAILAILASITFVALNPAELLRKARDSQRLADLASIRTAVNYYIANTGTPYLGNSGNGCAGENTPTVFSHVTGVVHTSTFTTAATTTTQGVDGTGWIRINLSALAGGSPLAKWPIDPNPTTSSANPGRYYAYVCSGTATTFTAFANMESSTYANGGASDVESKDGGALSTIYEVGSSFSLITATAANFFAGSS